MVKYEDTIGIVGGMGSFATLNFFERLLYAFPAEKEWDRPRIIIDNRCTMPSRVRAVLYEENVKLLIKELSNSIQGLIFQGATKIVLICNTAHIFLEDVFELIPEAKKFTINIIENLADEMKHSGISKASLIATEGTILSNIYKTVFSKYNISLNSPGIDEFNTIRYFIEQVKTMHLTTNVINQFSAFIESLPCDNVVLGCTEFPILNKKMICSPQKNIWDPLEAVINKLKYEIK